MPIRTPNDLPAVKTLLEENIFVMNEERATSQDIRPLKILLLNLMPNKIATETQLSRVLGNTPLQINVQFVHTKTHVSKNTSKSHIESFYNRNCTGFGWIASVFWHRVPSFLLDSSECHYDNICIVVCKPCKEGSP